MAKSTSGPEASIRRWARSRRASTYTPLRIGTAPSPAMAVHSASLMRIEVHPSPPLGCANSSHSPGVAR